MPVDLDGRVDVKIVAPAGKRLLEDRGQLIDLPVGRHIGEENQPAAFHLANPFGRRAGFIDAGPRHAGNPLARAVVALQEIGQRTLVGIADEGLARQDLDGEGRGEDENGGGQMPRTAIRRGRRPFFDGHRKTPSLREAHVPHTIIVRRIRPGRVA